jgi:hypothetical protein
MAHASSQSSQSLIAACPLLVDRDSLRGAATCPKLGLDQKSRAKAKNDTIDPSRTG